MERLTSRQLRAQAASSGYQFSGERFNDIRAWGLLPEPDADGCWPGETADRLIRIGELGRSIRSMPRRVILLRYEGVPVPPDKVQEAMCNVIPTIGQPVRKMKQAMKARKALAGPQPEALSVRERKKRERDAWAPPAPDKWLGIMQKAVPSGIERHFGIWCLAAQWARERVRDTPDDISKIPMEELVTLFAIQDIAAVLEGIEREQQGSQGMETA